MEENPVVKETNVRELRPGTTPKTDRERDLVDLLLTRLREAREKGTEVDSIMFVLAGKHPTEDEDGGTYMDPSWLSQNFWIAEDRPTTITLSHMTAFIQFCLMENMRSGLE